MIKKTITIFTLVISLTGCEKITDNNFFKKDEMEQKCSEQSEIGRYQIVLEKIGTRQTYMIDTKTGRIWRYVMDPFREGTPTYWEEKYVENNKNCTYSYELFNQSFPFKKSIESSDIKP